MEEVETMLNLDYKCMEYAQKIILKMPGDKIKNTENNIRKSLGVLQEDGVYAMFLWLEDKDKEKKIRKNLTDLLNESEISKYFLSGLDKFPDNDFKKFCEKLKRAAKDIDELLFMKKILERTLTYSLYHSKLDE
jgi:hypothetical protein